MGEYATLLAEAVLRQRAWEAEQAARIEAELARKIRAEFLANMSHEFRTPLNTVIGFAQLIAEYKRLNLSRDQVVEYAELIHDAATRVLAAVNDIVQTNSTAQPETHVTPCRVAVAAPGPAAPRAPTDFERL